MSNDSDWPGLIESYQDAVRNFESVATALYTVLSAEYPLDSDFLDLIAAEERARETVILARMRLINRWRDSLDETRPLRIIERPDRTH